MQRYFIKEKQGNNFILHDTDLHHIKNVMRNKINDQIEIVYNESNTGKSGYFTLNGLVVADARCPVTVKVYKNSTSRIPVATFQDSIEAYVARNLNGDEALKNLLEDFMKFADSAKSYLKDRNNGG